MSAEYMHSIFEETSYPLERQISHFSCDGWHMVMVVVVLCAIRGDPLDESLINQTLISLPSPYIHTLDGGNKAYHLIE